MARYLISFDRGWMTFPDEDLPDVARDARAAVREIIDAGQLVFTGGIGDDDPTQVVGTDGIVTDGPYPETKEMVGGFAVVEVPTREDAIAWAKKLAVACRCAQEVREFLPDPFVDEFLGR